MVILFNSAYCDVFYIRYTARDMNRSVIQSKPLSKAALCLWWTLMFIGTHWPHVDQYKPDTGWPIPWFGVVMHSLLYGGWMVAWWWVLRVHGYRLDNVALGWLLAGGGLYAAFDEVTQSFVARSPGFGDWLTNVVAVALVALLIRRLDPQALPHAPHPE